MQLSSCIVLINYHSLNPSSVCPHLKAFKCGHTEEGFIASTDVDTDEDSTEIVAGQDALSQELFFNCRKIKTAAIS
jgi:hypothetical protein